MAEAMASEIAKFVGEKLLSRGVKEIGFTQDINSHIESLVNSKIIIEALLQDADTVQSPSQVLLPLLERLSCVVDKVDDFLDMKAARAKMQQVMGGRSKKKKQVLLFLSASVFRDAKKVKAIREELHSIARDNAEFGNPLGMLSVMVNQMCLGTKSESGSDIANTEVVGRGCETWSFIINDEVIGRDRDRDDLINMLLGSSNNGFEETLSVVPIVGIGGIGKSTLAQYVYNDERVKINFDLRIWVWATQNFEVRVILKKILACVTDEKPGQYGLDKLQCQVRKQISGKKYFLVLDNVWDHQNLSVNWGQLRNLLLSGAPESRILITTRSESVARILRTKSDPFMLMGLASEDSWLLFQRIAFRLGQEHGVEAIGKEIARMCCDVPLVIHTIGGLLAEKCTVKEWRAFRDDEFANLSAYGSNIVQTLRLSYNPLDPRLKLCFAYCSLFPKGSLLTKRKLIHIFIALGYVKKEYKNQSLMDAGEECLLSLVKRGFFLVALKDEIGRIEEFKMHDLIHDLAVSIAGCKLKMVESKYDKFDDRVRHVSFSREADVCFESLSKIRHLGSLLVRGPRSTYPKLTGLSKIFPYLRVLSLEGVGMQEVPTSVGKLIHLRHLDLSNNTFCELPKSIKWLVYLQSLDLCGCTRLKQLPGEIGELSNLLSLDLTRCISLEMLPGEMSKLVKLRHLLLYGCWGLRQIPIGLGNLTNLQRLDWFIAREASPSDVGGELSELNALNNLEGQLQIILGGHQCESRAANLQMKEKLMALELNLYSLKENHEKALEGLQPHANLRRLMIWNYNGKSLPSWMMKNQLHCSLPNLVLIGIEGADCKLTHLCSFGRLLHLQHLMLRELNSVEYIEEDEEAAPMNGEAISEVAPLFPSLEKLTLSHMPKLKGWRRGSRNTNESARPPSFPRLKHLEVSNVGLEDVPDEFRGLRSLQTLGISRCEQLKEILEWIDDFTSLKTLRIYKCPKLMPLPKQIGNLPNLESISICRCPGAFAEWWKDPTLPDCPIKQLPPENDKEWKWEYRSQNHDFWCYKRKILP